MKSDDFGCLEIRENWPNRAISLESEKVTYSSLEDTKSKTDRLMVLNYVTFSDRRGAGARIGVRNGARIWVKENGIACDHGGAMLF
jgi:hypothetical protein